jgi:uroporphyrinogen-III synthase
MKGGPSRTQNAARFAAEIEIQRLARQSGEDKPVLVALSGQASPRLQTALQSRGFTMHDRISPGPLK